MLFHLKLIFFPYAAVSHSSKVQLHHEIKLDCRYGLARNQIISSSNTARYCDTFKNLDSCEVEFQAQACIEESFGHFLLSLGGVSMVTDDASPLLPNNHFYSNVSRATRKQAIEEGRKELTEMMRNMPESSYELSLKDIVDQKHEEAVQEKAVSEDKSIHLETERRTKKHKKKKKRKVGPIFRTGSMDTDRFLIKMFFPSTLRFKKNSTAENSSKVSPRPSCEGSEKPVDKQGWIKRFFVPRNHKNREDSNSNSIDSNNSSTSRHANRSSLPGCWLFFLSKKSKAKKQSDFII